MKYKKGDKFLIEIGAERLGDPILYRIKGFNTLVFDESGLDRLQRYEEPHSSHIWRVDSRTADMVKAYIEGECIMEIVDEERNVK